MDAGMDAGRHAGIDAGMHSGIDRGARMYEPNRCLRPTADLLYKGFSDYRRSPILFIFLMAVRSVSWVCI